MVRHTSSDTAIVGPLSFQVAPGEILGLVGESGSGKTTAGLALLGYSKRNLEVASGSIQYDGVDLLQLSKSRVRGQRGRRISYVPQDPSTALNPSARIGRQFVELLTHHLHLSRSEATDQARTMLAEVGLPSDDEFLRRCPFELSGGQQQRVAIAMAFSCKPRLVVLDEPTTGLDVSSQQVVLNVIRTLTSSHGTSCVYISHDLSVVAVVATRIGVMYSGSIVEEGSVAEVFNAPRHPYTARLLASSPDVERVAAVVGIPGNAPSPLRRPQGCPFAPRCNVATEECSVALPDLVPIGAPHRWRCIHPIASGQSGCRPPLVNRDVDRAKPPVLQVAGLDARYGARQVLWDINLEVREGNCLALIGESGSGKTTLGRVLCGIHPEAQGEVFLRGEPLALPVQVRSRQQLRSMSYVFQNPYSSLNPRRTVGDNVARPLKLSRQEDRDKQVRVLDALRRVALNPDYANRFPGQLSGGERQRVAIARALVTEPKFLICDEVTSALDVSVQASIVSLLARLQREMGLGILFITHDLALVRQIAHDVAVIRVGRIVENADSERVFTAPHDAYTKELLELTPRPSRLAATLADPERRDDPGSRMPAE